MVQAEERMNICFLGSARYTFPLDVTAEKKFRTLSDLGSLFVIGFSALLRPWRFTQHARFYALPLLPFAPLRYLEFFFAGGMLTLWLIFRHDCRIIIAQSPYEGVVAAIAKQIAGWGGRKVALIVESHGDFEADLFLQRHIVFASAVRWLMRRVARFTLNRADALRAISHSTRQQLRAWRPDCVIEQFIAWTDIEAFLHAKTGFQKSSHPLVLYAGVLIPGKGVCHLLNAFAAILPEFSQARLVIIGRDQNPEYARQLRKWRQQRDMVSQIEFLAEMPQQQLAKYMARAHIFVLPSLSEGLGRVVVEAMAAGTPVIGSRIGGIPDLIEDGKTGFLTPPGDETALAEKMRWLLNHPEEMQTMGEQAHQFAQTFFSAALYLQGYQKLCDIIL